VIGGVAAVIWGSPRNTEDIDILRELQERRRRRE
jgi:hypothetical protein